MGGVSKTPTSSDTDATPVKRGRKTAWERFMAMKAVSKESKAERQDSKPDNSTNFMEMYMMMQQERA
eukprot:630806-Rhodomonas_salina.1